MSRSKSAFKILHLEDNEMDVLLVQKMLEQLDFAYDLKACGNGLEFEKLVQSYSPDLVLSDYVLPGYSGFHALNFVRENCPSSLFVFVTSSVDPDLAADTILAGADGFVLKNKLGQLIHSIKAAIDRSNKVMPSGALKKEIDKYYEITVKMNRDNAQMLAECEAIKKNIQESLEKLKAFQNTK